MGTLKFSPGRECRHNNQSPCHQAPSARWSGCSGGELSPSGGHVSFSSKGHWDTHYQPVSQDGTELVQKSDTWPVQITCLLVVWICAILWICASSMIWWLCLIQPSNTKNPKQQPEKQFWLFCIHSFPNIINVQKHMNTVKFYLFPSFDANQTKWFNKVKEA